MNARVIILFGAPGGGKGTQATRLSAELKLPHVSTGDLFRENLAQGTALGLRAKSFMESGKLVPDDVVLDMLFDRVARPDCKQGYLLDGFPRTLPQAAALDARLAAAKASVQVIHLKVPESVLVERLVGRRTCKQCGNIHHVKFSAPKAAGRCDKCNGELEQRRDDSPDVVTKRLATYRAETQPLEGHYKQAGILHEVDGNRPADEVFKALKQIATGVEVR
ncbi:MAG: adenylate kinase [Planctomycetes bacterium]|nr:adenylate kinase [Planctomycetota bacterium]